MEVLTKVLRQTSWQLAGKVVSSVSTVIVLGIIARNYHEAGTGIFTLSITYLSIFNLLGDFGFNAHVLRQEKSDWQKLLGSRIIWSLTLAVVAILLLITLPFNSSDISKAVLIGGLAIVGSSIFTTCNLIFQSKHRYDLSVLATSIGTIFSLGLYVWLTTQFLPVPFLLSAYLTGWLLTALVSLFLVKRFLPSILPLFDIHYSVNLFKESWPIAATLALNVIYFRVDAFIVSFYHGITAAGIYNVAYSLFQTALVLPTFVMNAYYPLMLKSLSKIKLMGVILLSIAGIGTLLTQILAPSLINLLTGGGFSGGAESLRILSLSFPAFFASSLLMWIMITKGKYKSMLVIYTFGLLFNLILNFYFVPSFSYIGASYTTVISEYLILTLQLASLFL